MVNITLKIFISFIALTVFLNSYAQVKSESSAKENNNLTVLVKYKTQPEKEDAALLSLNTLIVEVKKEPHFINIKILVDPADKTNILLLEEWSDADYYKGDHMNTAHLQKFMGEARNLLAGPPEITFWMLNNIYTAD